jgi:thiol-disulfide isomerase/thioredoxin
MVAFVAPWCGHCKTLGPEFSAAAASLSPLIPFYAIDCDAAANKPLCGEQGVQGFPTIKAFPRAGKGAAREYRGERKKGALVEYAKELVPDRVKKLRADEGADKVLSKFLEEVRQSHSNEQRADNIEIRPTSRSAHPSICSIDSVPLESAWTSPIESSEYLASLITQY